jgi:plasmid stabilization system protein ParE
LAPYWLTLTAANDIDGIWRYIAGDNLDAANRVEEVLYDACYLLGTNPMIGSTPKRTTKLPVRFWPVPAFPNYIIVYIAEPSPVQVIGIMHGKRNIRKLLQSVPW